MVHACTQCPQFLVSPLGGKTATKSGKGLKFAFGRLHPEIGRSGHCSSCDSAMHVPLPFSLWVFGLFLILISIKMGGPLYIDRIHDRPFLQSLLKSVEGSHYKTLTRINGMVTLAAEELEKELFYYRPDAFSKIFKSNVIPLRFLASALHHLGYVYSLSHCSPGTIKTDAPMPILLRIHKAFHHHPELLKIKSYNETSCPVTVPEAERDPLSYIHYEADTVDPATGEPWVNFRFHPASILPSSKIKLVRYQENPTSHWGPGTVGKRYLFLFLCQKR